MCHHISLSHFWCRYIAWKDYVKKEFGDSHDKILQTLRHMKITSYTLILYIPVSHFFIHQNHHWNKVKENSNHGYTDLCDSFNPKAEAGQNTFLDLCTIHRCTDNIGLIKGCVLHGVIRENEGTFQQMMMPEEQEEKMYTCVVR